MNLLSNNDLKNIEHAMNDLQPLVLEREYHGESIKVSVARVNDISRRLWGSPVLIQVDCYRQRGHERQVFASVDDLIESGMGCV